MIAESDQLAGAVEPALEEMKARPAGRNRAACRPRRFHSSFTGAPTFREIQAASAMKSLRSRRPKPPPMRVMLTVTSLSAMPKRRRHELGAGPGNLRRRPEHDLAVLEVRRAVLRLEVDMGEERIGVGRLDDMRGALQRWSHVAVAAQIGGRRFACASLAARLGEALAALRRGRAFVPGDFELVARLARRPPAFRDDGDAVAEPLRIAARDWPRSP